MEETRSMHIRDDNDFLEASFPMIGTAFPEYYARYQPRSRSHSSPTAAFTETRASQLSQGKRKIAETQKCHEPCDVESIADDSHEHATIFPRIQDLGLARRITSRLCRLRSLCSCMRRYSEADIQARDSFSISELARNSCAQSLHTNKDRCVSIRWKHRKQLKCHQMHF